MRPKGRMRSTESKSLRSSRSSSETTRVSDSMGSEECPVRRAAKEKSAALPMTSVVLDSCRATPTALRWWPSRARMNGSADLPPANKFPPQGWGKTAHGRRRAEAARQASIGSSCSRMTSSSSICATADSMNSSSSLLLSSVMSTKRTPIPRFGFATLRTI